MRGPPGRGSRLRRQHKGGLRGDHAASNPSPRPSEARGPTTGCTAGARCPRGHSAGAGGSRGSGQQAHRGRRPRRGRAGTRSRSRTLPGRTPPLRPPLLSSWVGRLRRSLSRAGPRGTDALWAHEWAVRSEGSPSPSRPPPLARSPQRGCLGGGPALRKQGPQGCDRLVPILQSGEVRGSARSARDQPYRRSLASSSPRGCAAWHTPGHSWPRCCTRLPDGPLAHCLLGPQNSRQRGRPGGTQQGGPSEKGQPLSQQHSLLSLQSWPDL